MDKERVDRWLERNAEYIGIDYRGIKSISEGESNHNFIIETGSSKLVLRVSKDISRESRLENEAEKLDFLQEEGVENIPRKVFFQKEAELGEVLIETFVGDQDLDRESMTQERIRSLAEKLAEIHSIPVEKFKEFSGKEVSEKENLRDHYIEDFSKWSKRPYEEYIELADDPRKEIKKYYRKQKKLLEKIPDEEVEQSLVHGDLGFNVRATGAQVFIVDWEFSRIDYPGNEIIYCFEHEKLDEKQKELFLEEYRKHRDLGENFEKNRRLYTKFLAFNDMIWAAKRVEQGEEKHQQLLEERIEYIEKLYEED